MQIRDFTGADFDPLSRMLGKLWHARHGEHAFWQGADELCEHLAQTDKGLVAVDDEGNLAGVVLLASANAADHNDTLRMHWLQQRTRLAAMASALGIDARADARYLVGEQELMDRAAAELGSDGVGEIVLLVVVDAARGAGLGKELFEAGTSWLAGRDATVARLVTDEGCNWQFYEHLGLERVLEDTATDDDGEPFSLFVYQQRL